MDTPGSHNAILPQLFRQEYARMTAVLCRHFGLHHIATAEDIVSDTFLKASEHWAVSGIPGNPVAWLHTVARNKARDHFRHLAVSEAHARQEILYGESGQETESDYDSHFIADSQLRMIFAVCSPANTSEGQICLALRILCGFTVEEIAGAFMVKNETIKKRLQRARANLRNDDFRLTSLSEKEIGSRLDTVLKTLYLLFSEGYFSRSNDQQVRIALCSEAARLTHLLTENPMTCTPEANALLALICFQSSRLPARTDENGAAVPFGEQDRSLWDQSLILRGNYYLANATAGKDISRYHLEAAIAYWHTTPAGEHRWKHILELYNRLLLVEYSPVAALNRTFALAKVYGNAQAIREAEKLGLTQSSDYHELLGYLYAATDKDAAVRHYTCAIALIKSKTGRQRLRKEIENLQQNPSRR